MDMSRYIAEGIKHIVAEAFDKAQSNCPVRTGNLKFSGRLNEIPEGYEIIYTAPYSASVEFGIPVDIPIRGTYVTTVKGHYRKGKYVKPHIVVYKNKRPIPIDGEFRVIDKIKAREGQFFVRRGVEETMEMLGLEIVELVVSNREAKLVR